MDRIEIVREYVDKILYNMSDESIKRHAYIHLYGVAQACAILALKRNENAELSVIAGMLHDIYTYTTMDSSGHAHKGAAMAKDIMHELDIFTEDEIEMVCGAIYHHSTKREKHSPFEEVVIDADVLQHCLYHPFYGISEKEKERFTALKEELGLQGEKRC